MFEWWLNRKLSVTFPKGFNKKGFINSEDQENIKKLCETVLSEFLHQPTTQLKSISKHVECDMVLGTVQSVFGLEGDSATIHNCEHAIKFNN